MRSLRQVALQAGIGQPTLQRYMTGVTDELELRTLRAVGKLFGVTVSELIGEVPLLSDVPTRSIITMLAAMTLAQREQLVRVAKELLGL